MDSLSIAEAIQYNLKNLKRLKNDPACRTVYDLVCGQVDTLVRLLDEEDECDHVWLDADNEVVSGTDVCVKCYATCASLEDKSRKESDEKEPMIRPD